jgi:NADPH:quinone reductase-like Zn-dependent oxidoreductase
MLWHSKEACCLLPLARLLCTSEVQQATAFPAAAKVLLLLLLILLLLLLSCAANNFGGFQQVMRAPADFAYVLPDSLDSAAAAPLLCAGELQALSCYSATAMLQYCC